nr:(2Fe-2S)-binding protein [arsenite-oxidising bacterium NT-25]
MRFLLNGKTEAIPEDLADEPLLFVLRDHFKLNGPKFGCGVGSCGACTVVADGQAQRSCLLSAGSLDGRAVMTLEGLSAGEKLHLIQECWIAESVPQCGYCQNGQIMTAYALLAAQPDAGADEISATMDAVLCRCGTHARIRKAIARAQAMMREER